ncbi:dihydrofolate reductase family protein, partial [Sphingomonas sp.]|uniref:dihydrofolate reductase family protein n=1 Tax=Sphingomonas sp. TaxID=28214 RepID=UPI00286E3381
MRRIRGGAFVSLDGVMQAPGGPEEDWTGGFAHGGWLAPLFDETTGAAVDKLFTEPFDLLLGRRTYDIFAAYWPYATGDSKPMGELFDRIGKYVLTRGNQPLEWQNSHRVSSFEALAELKRGDGPDLVIQGSSTLYPQLLAAGLIDQLTLMIFPVVLGSGKRLFGDGTPPRSMIMVEQTVSPGGAVIATYQPAGEVKSGSFAAEQPSEREKERQEQMKLEG